MDKPFILDPKTGFKLMEHLSVHHLREDETDQTRANVRELKQLHDKLHILYPEIQHTHRKSRK